MMGMTGGCTRVLLVLALLLPALPAAPPPESRPPLPSWRIWWLRNSVLLLPEQLPPAELRRHWKLAHRPGLAAGREDWLACIRRGDDQADAAMLRLGLLGRPADQFVMLDGLREGGAVARAATLGLGLYHQDAAVGHLESLLRDRLAGRHLTGDAGRPVPVGVRAAAALGLGLSGRPEAYQALREILDVPGIPGCVGASALVALSFSPTPSDAVRFERFLRRGRGTPLMREAAAAALGRHAGHVPGARRLLVRLLDSDPECAGRGAAVGLWFENPGETHGEVEALRRAARASPDLVLRLLALMTLAGRGDAEVAAVIDAALETPGPERSYAVLATGLLGRARPAARARSLRVLHRLDEDLPGASRAALALLQARCSATRPSRGRTLAHLAGGSALLADSPDLQALLDLAAVSAR